MPEPPPGPSNAGSSDDAASHPRRNPRFARPHAPEGNAYAAPGYATPTQTHPHGSPLIHPDEYPPALPSYYSFDPYAQTAWDWTNTLGLRYEQPQGEPGSLLLVTPLAPPPRPLPQRGAPSPRMKRKSDADRELQSVQSASEAANPSKRRAVSRASSTASQSPAPTVLADAQPSSSNVNVAQNSSSSGSGSGSGGRKSAAKGTGPQGKETDVSEPRRVVETTGSGADLLPAGRVFPIQIGSALFRLSGASLCSDAPSYFSHFFADQLRTTPARDNDLRTLYIDRDPDTFRDIALHLQGYHIVPRDGEHFVKLFADAQFYSLPRLTKQLFNSDIFISIGGTPFRIPRDSFAAPGNSPNYFSLGFAQWFSTPSEVFPGLDRSALLRPPSISPPSVPNKSGETFADLMKMLQGYEVEIRNPSHRANLLRDARYFHLKGLEQRLIACETRYNLSRAQNEIHIRLEDIRQSGVGFLPDLSSVPGTVTYARPYTDDATANHILLLETSASEPATLRLHDTRTQANVSFTNDTLRRITALFAVVAAKLGLPATALAPGVSVRVHLTPATALTLDGAEVEVDSLAEKEEANWAEKGEANWTVRRASWRVRVQLAVDGERDTEVVLEAVRLDLLTERGRNKGAIFLER